MRKLIFSRFAGAVLLLCLVPAWAGAQATAGFTFVLPTKLSACGLPQDVVVKVYNKSAVDTLFPYSLTLALPTGVFYEKSSVKNASESNVSKLSRPVFTIGKIKPRDTLSVTVKVFTDCSIIAYINSGGSVRNLARLDHSNGADSLLSGTYNVAQPSLSITSVSNQVFSGNVGDTFSRNITLTNSGSGPLRSFTLNIIVPSGLRVDSIGRKTKITNGDTVIAKFTGADIKKIGNGDSVLNQNEKIQLRVYYTIKSCVGLTSKYIAVWGCSNKNCASFSSSGNVLLSNKLPKLTFVANATQSTCYDTSTANLQTLTVTNTGAGPALEVFLDIYFTTNPGAGTYPYYYSSLDTSGVTIKYNSGAAVKATFDAVAAGYDYGCLKNKPVALFRIKLSEIKPGDKVVVSFNVVNCCLDKGYINGWGYEGTYKSQCLTTVYNIAPGWGRVYTYQLFGAHVANTTDLIVGDTITYNLTNNYTYNRLLPGAGNHTIQYVFYLPPGVKISTKSIVLYNNTSAIRFSPDSVTVSGKNVVTVTFGMPPPSGFDFNYSRLEMRMYTDTSNKAAKCGDIYNMKMTVYYQPRIGCNCISELYSNNYGLKFNCPNPDKVGLINNSLQLRRTSYGKPDNNDDGLADATGSLDFTKIQTGRAMYGDTVSLSFSGKVKTDSNHTSWTYAFANLKFSENVYGVIGTAITIKDSSASKTYSGKKIPYSTSAGWMNFLFNPDTLRYYGASLPSGFTFQNNDSVRIEIKFVVKQNTQSVKYTSLQNYFYFSDTVTPVKLEDRYYVRNFPAAMTTIGYYFTSWGANYYSYDGCGDASFSESFYLSIGNCCANYGGGNLFPYEFRNWAHLADFKIKPPQGYVFKGAAMYYYRTAGTGKIKTHTKTGFKPYTTTSDTLVFSADSLFTPYGGNFPLPDDGFHGTFIGYFTPGCDVATGQYDPVHYSHSYRQSAFLAPSTKGPYKGTDYAYYTKPATSILPALKTVNVLADTFSWTVYAVNLSNSSLIKSAWFAPVNAGGKIIIDSIYNSANNRRLKEVNGIYRIDTLAPNKTYSFRIRAQMNNCIEDSIRLVFGWNCPAFPDSLGTNTCPVYETYLNALPIQPSLQISLVSAADSIYLCDTGSYTIEIENVNNGVAKDAEMYIYIPEGIKLVQSANKLHYPATATPVAIGAADSLNPYVYRFTLSDHSTSIAADGLPGIYDTSKNKARISFRLVSDCQFISGTWVDFSASPIDACGKKIMTAFAPGKSLKIIGAREPYATRIRLKMPSTLAACPGTPQNMRVSIVNTGIVKTDSTDFIYLFVP
ncbi:MAG: hypothetical protein M3Q97_03645, partial [Bacteroidota bacterium]|nr:hypothetical protein [Bacteroidota bacterium]